MGRAAALDHVGQKGPDYVRMLHGAAHLPLPAKALQEVGRLDKVGMHDLQGHPLATLEAHDGLGYLGEIDRTHAAGAKLLQNLKTTQPIADQCVCTKRQILPSRAEAGEGRRFHGRARETHAAACRSA
jgi:hypothetical protein